MTIETLHDLYVDELESLYDAEHQWLIVLPGIAKAASNFQLAHAFMEHSKETGDHVDRLNEIFEMLDVNPIGRSCKAMETLIEEGRDAVANYDDPAVLDVVLIAVAQGINHYTMARYGCLRTFARLLGYEEAADLLQESLDEEADADRRLTKLAETVININAVSLRTLRLSDRLLCQQELSTGFLPSSQVANAAESQIFHMRR